MVFFYSPIGYSFLAYHQFAILIRLWPIFRRWGKILSKHYYPCHNIELWSTLQCWWYKGANDLLSCASSDLRLNLGRVAVLSMSVRVFCEELVCQQGWEGREKFYHSRCRPTGARIPIPSDHQTPFIIIIVIIHISYYRTISNSFSKSFPQFHSLITWAQVISAISFCFSKCRSPKR